ncbi:MAG: diacylglycerol kinase family protein [Anaerolineales bacterium]|nr:diacylglycerol kinase family protein [Anaerolineales bacterium]
MNQSHRAVSRLAAFRHAFNGFKYVLRSQRNAWIHTVASTAAILLCIWLNPTTQETALIIVAIGMVWMAEFLNTALEAVVDLASPDLHPLARVGKDVGAAAVLIAAVTAAAIGLLIFGPLIVDQFSMVTH